MAGKTLEGWGWCSVGRKPRPGIKELTTNEERMSQELEGGKRDGGSDHRSSKGHVRRGETT